MPNMDCIETWDNDCLLKSIFCKIKVDDTLKIIKKFEATLNKELTTYNDAFIDLTDFPTLQKSQKQIDKLKIDMKKHLEDIKELLRDRVEKYQCSGSKQNTKSKNTNENDSCEIENDKNGGMEIESNICNFGTKANMEWIDNIEWKSVRDEHYLIEFDKCAVNDCIIPNDWNKISQFSVFI